MAGRTTIILDAEILRAQIHSLADHGQTIAQASSAAGVSMPGTAFGRMNSYLPGPINDLAGHAETLLGAVSEMLSRMGEGVDGVFRAFDTIEQEAADKIAELEP